MDQVLQSIDSDLTDLEENLLEELSRLLKLESTDTYCRLKPDRKGGFRLILEALEDALEHSGDRATSV